MAGNQNPWTRARAAIGLVRTSVASLRAAPAPRWTQTPNDLVDVSELREDQQEIAAGVSWTRDAERIVIDRILADVRATEDDEGRPVRLLSCWLSLDDARAVRVHVGDDEVGTLETTATLAARAVIVHHGGPRHAVGTFAELHGDSIDTAVLTVFLPDRP